MIPQAIKTCEEAFNSLEPLQQKAQSQINPENSPYF